MLELVNDFKALGLHGMASAWPEVLGTARIKAMDHELQSAITIELASS